MSHKKSSAALRSWLFHDEVMPKDRAIEKVRKESPRRKDRNAENGVNTVDFTSKSRN